MADEPRKRNKAQRIRNLAAEGLTISEIMEKTGCTYQHVYNTLRYSRGMKNPIEAKKASKARIDSRRPDPTPPPSAQTPTPTPQQRSVGEARAAAPIKGASSKPFDPDATQRIDVTQVWRRG